MTTHPKLSKDRIIEGALVRQSNQKRLKIALTLAEQNKIKIENSISTKQAKPREKDRIIQRALARPSNKKIARQYIQAEAQLREKV